MRKSLAYVSLAVISVIAALAPAHSDGRFWLVGEPTKGEPTCEEFFDKWDVPGAPAGMLAMAGVGREVAAANDCVKQNKIDLACKHWQAIVANLDKAGPPLNASRGDVIALMQRHNCESVPAPEQGSQSPAGAAPLATRRRRKLATDGLFHPACGYRFNRDARCSARGASCRERA